MQTAHYSLQAYPPQHRTPCEDSWQMTACCRRSRLDASRRKERNGAYTKLGDEDDARAEGP